jgi:hypothetical protein
MSEANSRNALPIYLPIYLVSGISLRSFPKQNWLSFGNFASLIPETELAHLPSFGNFASLIPETELA